MSMTIDAPAGLRVAGSPQDQSTPPRRLAQASPAEPETVIVERGPGWAFTIATSILALALGGFAGMSIDGSLEVLNAYNLASRKAAPSTVSPVDLIDHAAAGADEHTTPAWYPDNNKVEWSTSLPIGQQPASLDIRNESRTQNRRLIFQLIEAGVPRQAAILYVRAGEQAIIQLPLGDYRIDVASTPSDLPWEKAKDQTPVPTFSIPLHSAAQGQIPEDRLFLDEDGQIRQVKKPVIKEFSPRKKESAAAQSEEPAAALDDDEISYETDPDEV
ncbi:hypothetical protein [Sphingosinicella sp. BN140058]|uniref:hypothetical protein n=1 Tax=Sphingosinicella sp. BN140058 TaxID=1892855 RepID=UPI0010132ECD|nr:hypothetical protein [Sphingosinicella sp. BN140058]QAY80192.1 hypothetical protein ETR14_26480 [Sphingosinicella sp. BN140058]